MKKTVYAIFLISILKAPEFLNLKHPKMGIVKPLFI